MSALELHRIKGKGEKPACANRCFTGQGLIRSATTLVTIAGHPVPGEPGRRAGFYCGSCAEQMQRVWDAALEGEETPDQRVCACGCGTAIPEGSTWVMGHSGKDPSKRTYGIGSRIRERGKAKPLHPRVAA